jgi:hypothetical protein
MQTVEPGVNVHAFNFKATYTTDTSVTPLQGGITPWGTFVSLAGGQIISLAALACLAIEGQFWRFGLLESSSHPVFYLLIAVGGVAGFTGSLVRSSEP